MPVLQSDYTTSHPLPPTVTISHHTILRFAILATVIHRHPRIAISLAFAMILRSLILTLGLICGENGEPASWPDVAFYYILVSPRVWRHALLSFIRMVRVFASVAQMQLSLVTFAQMWAPEKLVGFLG
jgi:hypothetical protein